jgi:hypothetical protein
MILFAFTFLLILVFFYNQKVFIYALMVFYVLFDMFDGFYEDEKIFAAMRYVIPFIFISVYVVRHAALKKHDLLFFVVSIYLLILLVYSEGDIILSGKTVLAVLLTLLMVPIGRYIGRKVNFLEEFEPFNRFLLVALPVYILMANIYHFGESYSASFTTGFLITSRIYIVPIVVFLAIHYFIANRDRGWLVKGIDLTFILINVCVMIINTRRTALGMIGMALLVYAVFNRRLVFKMAILTVFMGAVLVFSFPLYEEILTAQMEKRERIQDLDTYEEEGRVLETLYIFDHHSRHQSVPAVLFGVKLFDTLEFGNRYFGRDRPIHSDLNMIFYSTGIVGLILFGLLFLQYFFSGNQKIAPENKKIYYPLLVMLLIVLLPGRFIGTMTYAPFLMLALSSVKAWRPAQVLPEMEENICHPGLTIKETDYQ